MKLGVKTLVNRLSEKGSNEAWRGGVMKDGMVNDLGIVVIGLACQAPYLSRIQTYTCHET